TGNAQTLEVVVIAGLPGTFVPGVEVDHLHRVGQVDRVVRIIKAGITAHALVGDREVVEARPQGNRQRRSVVVEIVTGGAVIRGLVVGQIGGQAQVVVQLGGVGDAGKMALPEVVRLRGIQRSAQGVGEVVGAAQVGDLVMIDCAVPEAVGVF